MARWLVASAWPYINYVPHLGTIIGSVLSGDVMARYLRSKGEQVLYVSGSDEHGTPIEVEAIKRGITPRQLTDENHEKVKKLFEAWKISFDNYTRTESPVHVEFVRDFYLKVYRNGYIFTQEEELPYCPNCRRFLPDRFVQGQCPKCGYPEAFGDQCPSCGSPLDPKDLINPRCTICGTTPEIRSTKHWYFDLPRFAEKLKKYVEENPRLPSNARNFSLKLLREGLKPRSLTRDVSWGIPAPFPGAEGKTIYVWMEAVLGYISATIEYWRLKGEEEKWREYWFNGARSIFFIGKDNIPFHVIILPALLMASEEGYELPWTVSSTEFLMFEGKKFSKSQRIGVWIDEALEMFPVDYWRYTLLSIRPEVRDTNFTWELFLEKVNADLNDTLGNFIHRTLTFLCRFFDCKVPPEGELTEADRQMLREVERAKEAYDRLLGEIRIQQAVQTVTELARKANKYFNDRQPWRLAASNQEEAATILHVASRVVEALASLLEAFTPTVALEIWRMLKLKPGENLKAGHQVALPKPLFRKVSLKEVEEKAGGGVKVLEEKVTPEDLARLGLKVAKIVEVEEVPGARKLYRIKLDLGGGLIKQTVAGLKTYYRADELLGKLVVVVSNMKPVKLMGLDSEVMILAAEDDGRVAILTPERPVKPGSRIL
ncbi:methionine--tRNA ligase [Candidatus Bathyarchaeota archaeon]|nr:MAG: methionine--tRNA ligase [Candidatus Bathyarchaeota archaeon]